MKEDCWIHAFRYYHKVKHDQPRPELWTTVGDSISYVDKHYIKHLFISYDDTCYAQVTSPFIRYACNSTGQC